MRAGDQAVSRSAYPEAIAHFSAGLKLAEALPPPDGMRRQLDFWLKLGSALIVAHGLQSVEAEDAYTEPARSARNSATAPLPSRPNGACGSTPICSRKTALARDRASELVTLAQRSGDGELLLEAYHCRWSTALFRGDVSGALDGSRNGVELYDMAQHRHLGHAFGGHDPGVCAHVRAAMRCNYRATCNRRAQHSRKRLPWPKCSTIPTASLMGSTMPASVTSLAATARPPYAAAHRAAALAEKFGLLPWRASSLILAGWATAIGAGVADAARLIDAEIGKATAVGPLPQYYLGLAAEVLLAAGRAGRRPRVISIAPSPGSTNQASASICRKSIACAARACWRSTAQQGRSAIMLRDRADIAERQGAVIFERRAEASLVRACDIGIIAASISPLASFPPSRGIALLAQIGP